MKALIQRKPIFAAAIVAAFFVLAIAGLATAFGHGSTEAAAPALSYMSVPF